MKTSRIVSAVSLLPVAALPAGWAQAPHGAEQQAAVFNFWHEGVLGTSLQVTVRAADLQAARRAEAAALAVFDRQTAVLSAWEPGSEFSRWERTRFVAVPVSPELLATLASFDSWRERTGGALDASVEAATRLWQRSTAEGRVPTDGEIAVTREAMAQPHWALDPKHGTATRLSDTPLALASFAKSRITAQAADAALAAGAQGVSLNVGGDVVVRGAMTQMVAIADSRGAGDEVAAPGSAAALDFVVVSDRAVATSGGYRRGFTLAGSARAGSPGFSHLIDPRTAAPVAHVASSTVIARDAETAGALATAFSVLPVQASMALAASTPGVDYLLVTAEGETLRSANWSRYQPAAAIAGQPSSAAAGPTSAAGLQPVSYAPPVSPAAGLWNPGFELTVALTLPRIDNARYRRPYVAVWIEDADHFPVRTLALWTQNPRWLPDLKQWYRDDQIRNLSEGSDISRTVGSATRPPGSYTLKWDGKDNAGKPVKAGDYTVVIEAAREHGGYQIDRHTLSFNGKPAETAVAAGEELGTVTLDYRKR